MEREREKETEREREREERRFIIGVGSNSYVGQEVLHSAICKLQNWHSLWFSSVWVQTPENPGSNVRW